MQPKSKNKGQGTTKAPPGTPYMNARREWNERYGAFIIEARNWRTMAVIGGIALILSLAMNIYQSAKEDVAVYHVNYGPDGRTREIYRVDQAAPTATTQQIRAALQDWVLGARTVYIDGRATRRVIDATYAMTLPKSAAFETLTSYHREHNPYVRAATETVETDIQTPVQLSKDTWMVEWTETVKQRATGKLLSEKNYQLTANVLVVAPKDEKQLMANPAGLYIRQFSWPARN